MLFLSQGYLTSANVKHPKIIHNEILYLCALILLFLFLILMIKYFLCYYGFILCKM